MIVVDGLRVTAGTTVILDGVDLAVPPGRLLGLVGPNGAGKSTLLRTIAGLHRPARGRVLLDGRPVHDMRPGELARRIAYLPQEATVAFPFTAYQVVLMGRHPHLGRMAVEGPADHEAAERAMTATGTIHLADRSIATLSGGERRLVLLAKALAQDTPVLLADEPLSALDLRHRLAVLHDLNLAARHCTELALLARGRVLAAGPPADVLTPDHLAAAYGVRAVVRRDDLTESLTVTALENT
jgi:iron complex transport system ATP-binding protein